MRSSDDARRCNVERKTIHGTLVKITARGILLMGESGSGKSRLALSLLYAGGRLVADDVVELTVESGHPVGRAPDRIRGLIEIRGIGIIDVVRTLGSPFVLERASIDMVVRLEQSKTGIRKAGPPAVSHIDVVGCLIPEIRVGTNIDSHDLICVISDVILGGSSGSERLKGLLGGPR